MEIEKEKYKRYDELYNKTSNPEQADNYDKQRYEAEVYLESYGEAKNYATGDYEKSDVISYARDKAQARIERNVASVTAGRLRKIEEPILIEKARKEGYEPIYKQERTEKILIGFKQPEPVRTTTITQIPQKKLTIEPSKQKIEQSYKDLVKSSYQKELEKSKVKTELFKEFWKSGEYNPMKDEIELNTLYPFAKKSTTAHEIGHQLDFSEKVIRDYSKYKESSKDLIPDILQNIGYKKGEVEKEYYARSFSNYITNPESFKRKYPEVAKEFELKLGIKEAPELTKSTFDFNKVLEYDWTKEKIKQGAELIKQGKEKVYDWTKEKITEFEIPTFIGAGTKGIKAKEIVSVIKETKPYKVTKELSEREITTTKGQFLPAIPISTFAKPFYTYFEERESKGELRKIEKETEKLIETKKEPEYLYLSEEYSKTYGEDIEKGILTEEQAKKQFEETKSYKEASKKYSEEYKKEYESEYLKKEKEYLSDKKFIDKALIYGDIAFTKAGKGVYGFLGGGEEKLTYGKAIKTGAYAYGGYKTMTLLPKLTMAYIYGYETPKAVYKVVTPRTISEKISAGTELGVIAGITGVAGYKKWKMPSIEREEILISPKLKPTETIPKLSKVLRTEEVTDVYGNTLSKNIQKASYLDEQLISGERVIVKQRGLLSPFKKVPIYEGVPYTEQEKYQKAVKELTKYNIPEAEIRKTLRYTAPKRIEYKLKSQDLTKDFADVKVYSGTLLEKPLVKVKGAVTEKLDVYEVDKLLGIKTRGGLGKVRYIDVTGELLGTKKDIELIKLYSREQEAILKDDSAYTKLSKAGKTTKEFEQLSGIKMLKEGKTIKQLNKDEIILYHGTSELQAKEILREGLLPKGILKEIYLTPNLEYAKGFAGRTVAKGGFKEKPFVLEVSLPKSRYEKLLVKREIGKAGIPEVTLKGVESKYIREVIGRDLKFYKETPVELYAEKSLTRQVIPKKLKGFGEEGFVLVEKELEEPLKISVDMRELTGINVKEIKVPTKPKPFKKIEDFTKSDIKNLIKDLEKVYGKPSKQELQQFSEKELLREMPVPAVRMAVRKVKPIIKSTNVQQVKNIINENSKLENSLFKPATTKVVSDLGETRFKDLTGMGKIKLDNLSRFKDLGVQETRFKDLTKEKDMTKSSFDIKDIEKEMLKDILITKPLPKLKETEKLKEVLKTKQVQKLQLKNLLRVGISTRIKPFKYKQPIIKTPPLVPFTFEFNLGRKEDLKKLLKGYSVFVKRKRKDVKIGEFEDLEKADRRLVNELKLTLRASGYVERQGKRQSFEDFVYGSEDFTTGMRKGKRDIFKLVQKIGGKKGGRGRLSTPSEISEIKIAKLMKGIPN